MDGTELPVEVDDEASVAQLKALYCSMRGGGHVKHVLFSGRKCTPDNSSLRSSHRIQNGDFVVVVWKPTASHTTAAPPGLPAASRGGGVSRTASTSGGTQDQVDQQSSGAGDAAGGGGDATAFSLAIRNILELEPDEFFLHASGIVTDALERQPGFSWGSSGWPGGKAEMLDYMRASLAVGTSAVVMRRCSRAHCAAVATLLAASLPTTLHGPGELPPLPAVELPPAATTDCPTGGEKAFQVSATLSAPAPPLSTEELRQEALALAARCLDHLRRGDAGDNHGSDYNWTERGWEGSTQFLAELSEGVARRGRGLVSVEQTQRRARLLQARLQRDEALRPAGRRIRWQFDLHGSGAGTIPRVPLLRDSPAAADLPPIVRLAQRLGGQELVEMVLTSHAGAPPAAVDVVNALERVEVTAQLLESMGAALKAEAGSASDSGSDDGPACAICAMEYEVGDEITRLDCGHEFGTDCIRHWLLDEKNTCPVCRTPLAAADAEADAIYQASRAVSDPTVPWPCANCSLMNPPDARNCSACYLDKQVTPLLRDLEGQFFKEVTLAVVVQKHLDVLARRYRRVARRRGDAAAAKLQWGPSELKEANETIEAEFARLLTIAHDRLDKPGVPFADVLRRILHLRVRDARTLMSGLPTNSQVVIRRLLHLLEGAPDAAAAVESEEDVLEAKYTFFPIEHALPYNKPVVFDRCLAKIQEPGLPDSAAERALVPGEVSLVTELVRALEEAGESAPIKGAALDVLRTKLLMWPLSHVLPCLDLLRVVLTSRAGELYFARSDHTSGLVECLHKFLAEAAPKRISGAIVLSARCIAVLLRCTSTSKNVSAGQLKELISPLSTVQFRKEKTIADHNLLHSVTLACTNAAFRLRQATERQLDTPSAAGGAGGAGSAISSASVAVDAEAQEASAAVVTVLGNVLRLYQDNTAKVRDDIVLLSLIALGTIALVGAGTLEQVTTLASEQVVEIGRSITDKRARAAARDLCTMVGISKGDAE